MHEKHVSGEILGQSTLEEITVHASKATFIELLRNLADGLESGREFEIEVKGQHVLLPPSGEMKIKLDQEERELEFEYTWRY